jgi:hypothetical protein
VPGLPDEQSPLNIVFHVDSGAGQSLCSCSDAFLNLRACAIQVIGISGSLPIFGVGTALFVIASARGKEAVLLIHNCLLSEGGGFNLVSVSQLQASGANSVSFDPGAASIRLKSGNGFFFLPLELQDGLYNFQASPLHINDERYVTLPRYALTEKGEYVPPTSHVFSSLSPGKLVLLETDSNDPMGVGALPESLILLETDINEPMGVGVFPGKVVSNVMIGPDTCSTQTLVVSTLDSASSSSEAASLPVSSMGQWSFRMFVLPSSTHRVLAYPGLTNSAFDSGLRDFCVDFLAPPSIPPARQTFNDANPLHMSDLSIRFMGAGNERLRRTIELSRGLAPATGRVQTYNFPQGKFAQGKTPKVSKGQVHHLHRAAICECLFMDTFESKDHRFAYGQAFVDYRSRFGDVIPLRSRKEVGWALSEFCCRNFTPLIVVRDNIAENKGGAIMEVCHRLNIQSAYICPMTPQQDQAENYLGRITTMASYAMVYAGAPLFFWHWAVQAAVFINNITATYYSREKVWSTPYTLVFGEPYPDSSVVVPFGCGCGALVLYDKDDREKFQSRCALLVFLHYATCHPIYTYAFYSPRTKRVLYRQDCIFLVNTFPMRMARQAQRDICVI